jgi:hypothetical protein
MTKKILIGLLLLLVPVGIATAAKQTIESGAGILWSGQKTKINANFTELYSADAGHDAKLALMGVEVWVSGGSYAEHAMCSYLGKLYVAKAGGASGTDDPATNVNQWTAFTGDGASTFAELSGNPTDNSALDTVLTAKQARVTGTCPGQVMTGINVDGTAICEDAATGSGDIEGVTASTGLTGGGTSGTVPLAIDPTYTQRRVSAECPVGQSIRKVYEDGSVDCEFDDGSGSTNLGSSTTTTTVTITSSAGADTTLPAATADDAGVMTAAMQGKLAGVGEGATDDQSGAEIKTAYESEADTNGFTDLEKTKLAGIGTGASNARASHIGTQVAATISDFESATAANASVAANTAKVSFSTTASTRLAAIEDGATADQAATEVPFTPAGTIAATNVQDAIEEVANEATGANLGNSPDADSVLVTSSSGTNTDIPAATTSAAGVMPASDKVLLNSAVQPSDNVTLGTISAGTGGFIVDADGDVIGKSFSVNPTALGGQVVAFSEDSDNGTNYVGFGSPASNDNDLVLLLPIVDPAAGQVLNCAAPTSVTFSDGVARDATVCSWVSKQDLNANLTDLADGSLSGGKVGTGINADNISTGTVADAHIASTIARDSEITVTANSGTVEIFILDDCATATGMATGDLCFEY